MADDEKQRAPRAPAVPAARAGLSRPAPRWMRDEPVLWLWPEPVLWLRSEPPPLPIWTLCTLDSAADFGTTMVNPPFWNEAWIWSGFTAKGNWIERTNVP